VCSFFELNNTIKDVILLISEGEFAEFIIITRKKALNVYEFPRFFQS
tara:strand:+ start:1450 stop:1590 length:141 start_codon:yes stop_codon:yes gene_type:complete